MGAALLHYLFMEVNEARVEIMDNGYRRVMSYSLTEFMHNKHHPKGI